jgi:hypothetical protein
LYSNYFNPYKATFATALEALASGTLDQWRAAQLALDERSIPGLNGFVTQLHQAL